MAAGPTASRGWISRGSSRRPRRSTRRPIRPPPPSARLSRRSRPRGSPPGAEQGRQPWQPSEQAGPGAGCRHQAAAPGRLECRPHAPGPPACASMPEQTGCSGEASPHGRRGLRWCTGDRSAGACSAVARRSDHGADRKGAFCLPAAPSRRPESASGSTAGRPRAAGSEPRARWDGTLDGTKAGGDPTGSSLDPVVAPW